MACKDRLKEKLGATLACQKLKKKHYGLQIFETCKLRKKNSLCTSCTTLLKKELKYFFKSCSFLVRIIWTNNLRMFMN